MAQFIEIVSEDERNVFPLGDSKIYYRRFDSEVYNRLHKKWTVDKGFDRRTGQRRQETDEQSLNLDLIDWIILGWESVKHPVTGEDVECTKEMKGKLPSSIKLQLIDRADAEKGDPEVIEGEKKNLETYCEYIRQTQDEKQQTITCDKCYGLHEQIDENPDCENCNNPELWQVNHEAYSFYSLLSNQFVYDFHLSPLVFELYRPSMTRAQAKIFFDKLVLIHSVMSKHEHTPEEETTTDNE